MKVYEQRSWMGLPGNIMRPGGFKLTKRLLDLSGLELKSKFLDLGCGLGATVNYLNTLGFQAVGIDCSVELIRQGRKKYPKADLLVGRGESLPFADKTLDAVLAECSLSTMKLQSVLDECARVLRKGGKLLVSDVYARQQADESLFHTIEVVNFLTRAKWETLLALCGFKLILWEDNTAVWKEFIAQVILERGNFADLFPCSEYTQLKKAKPGYFLALAQKTDTEN